MKLEQAIKKIDFKQMKEDLLIKTIVVDNEYIDSINFDYCDSDCEYDEKGYSYCINIKHMPFQIYPMRSYNYIKCFKNVKCMLNRLYKQVKTDMEVKGLVV